MPIRVEHKPSAAAVGQAAGQVGLGNYYRFITDQRRQEETAAQRDRQMDQMVETEKFRAQETRDMFDMETERRKLADEEDHRQLLEIEGRRASNLFEKDERKAELDREDAIRQAKNKAEIKQIELDYEAEKAQRKSIMDVYGKGIENQWKIDAVERKAEIDRVRDESKANRILERQAERYDLMGQRDVSKEGAEALSPNAKIAVAKLEE